MDNFEKFLNYCKELGVVKTDKNYILNLSAKNSRLELEFTNHIYVISFLYQPKQDISGELIQKKLIYEGAISVQTIQILTSIIDCFIKYNYVFLSCVFQKGFEELDILYLSERLWLAKLEYNYLLKHLVKVEEWDGSSKDIVSERSCISFCLVNLDNIPTLDITFSKCDDSIHFTKSFTLFDWLLDFENIYSWIDADHITYNVESLKPLPDEVMDYFYDLFKHFNSDINKKHIKNTQFQIPINNESILYLECVINDFGVVLKIFSILRPYKPYKVKLPLRKDVQHTFNILKGFLYLLSVDTSGDFVTSSFGFFKNIDSFYMNLFVGMEHTIKNYKN